MRRHGKIFIQKPENITQLIGIKTKFCESRRSASNIKV